MRKWPACFLASGSLRAWKACVLPLPRNLVTLLACRWSGGDRQWKSSPLSNSRNFFPHYHSSYTNFISYFLLWCDSLRNKYHAEGILIFLAFDKAEANHVEYEELLLAKQPTLIWKIGIEPFQIFQLYSNYEYQILQSSQIVTQIAHSFCSKATGHTIYE